MLASLWLGVLKVLHQAWTYVGWNNERLGLLQLELVATMQARLFTVVCGANRQVYTCNHCERSMLWGGSW